MPLAKRLGGIAPEREIPVFAEQTFTSWFAGRAGTGPAATRGSVVLWPDTFTNHLAPEVGRAAVEVLEAAGYEVVLPDGAGVLRADLDLHRTAAGARSDASSALWQCWRRSWPRARRSWVWSRVALAVLRRDAPELLPDDPLAAALAASTFTFAEFLTARIGNRHRSDATPWCRRTATSTPSLGFDADRSLMAKAGINAVVPDSGCCGLAGNFGFERGHYEVSGAVGERVLLPAVRAAAPDTAIVADGFSCRTQIGHGTPRRAVHLAQLLADGLREH